MVDTLVLATVRLYTGAWLPDTGQEQRDAALQVSRDEALATPLGLTLRSLHATGNVSSVDLLGKFVHVAVGALDVRVALSGAVAVLDAEGLVRRSDTPLPTLEDAQRILTPRGGLHRGRPMLDDSGKFLNIRVEASLLDAVRTFAKQRGITPSEAWRNAARRMVGES